jgi:exosome complex exonuclease DIS3/RRP44
VDRFAFSVLWEMTPDATIVEANTKFFKSSIHSKAAMTYAEAQTLLDDDTQQSPIATSVRNLNTIARHLR